MPRKSDHTIGARRHRGTWILLAGLMAFMVVVRVSSPPTVTLEKPTQKVETAFLTQLADARIDTAKLKLEQNRPDEALVLLVSALKSDPASMEAPTLTETLLGETTWNLPAFTLKHPMPVDQLAFAAPSALWVSLSGKNNTTVRWYLDTPQIESVLFPTGGGDTRSLVFDPTHQSVVVERNSVTLLCNAVTLKPIRDLGMLPDDLTPSAVVVFTPDGLLMAHPTFVSSADRSLVWRIRDSASGEIIRTSEPVAADRPRPLAAFLDRERLMVLATDGSLLEIPVSPVDPALTTPMAEPVKLLQAQFAANGNAVLALQDMGPHQPPTQTIIAYGGDEDASLETGALIKRFPWHRHPNMWSGIMKDPEHQPFIVEGNLVKILTTPHAPIDTSSPVSAIAFGEKNVVVGGEDGTVTIHRLLPPPATDPAEHSPGVIGKLSLEALENLGHALTGCRYDETARTFSRIGAEERHLAFANCDFHAILSIFPQLDFSALITEFKAAPCRTPGLPAFHPLADRLAQAAPIGKSTPGLAEMKDAFTSNDPARITAVIQTAGGKGAAMATALALALKSEHPEWIVACLAQAADLPPLLRRIAVSRIAWLQGRKADALSSWAEVFPDLRQVRLREDWSGWEQADFKPALDNLAQCVRDELAAIRISPDSTPEQRRAVADRLADAATVAAVGKPRFAAACLEVALALSAHKEEFETTSRLAHTARNLGAPPEPCLRTEALALTAMGDYQNARLRWVELITEHPVDTHLPGDYAEAAYTSFENGDPHQAIEILNTGIRHFPQDGNFAIRAGWVALLTGNFERAYKYLIAGKRIGFPSDKLENATALLTIAAARNGATDDATAYFEDLVAIDPAWEDPATLDTLDWPEELKSVLREFTLVALTPDLLPELAPTSP
jgi:tetratricopeptide (TPR) repeat protein